MKYCSECAEPVVVRTPPGDTLARYYCPACATVHYQNPRLITGTVPVFDGRILLCRRNIEPRFGYWTLPAGFMENGETLEEGALRETVEESLNRPKIQQLLSVISLPEFDQVHVFYLAKMLTPEFGPTPESAEVALFDLDALPWGEMAFRPVRFTLEHYVQNHDRADIPIYHAAIPPRPL